MKLSQWIKPQANGAEFKVVTEDGSHAKASLTFESSTVLRYRLKLEGAKEREKFLLTQPVPWASIQVHIEDCESYALLRSDDLAIKVLKEPWQISIFNSTGEMVTREQPQDVDTKGQYQSNPSGFWVPGQARANLELFPDEHLYGFGEKFTDLDKRGQSITLWNRNPYGSGRELSHKNIPFFVSSRGYGIFTNSTAPSHYHIGTESNFSYSINIEEEDLDLYLFYGPKLRDVILQYQQLTGLPAIPPKWAFGLWLSPLGEDRTGEDVSQDSILRMADEAREASIPSDVIHLDPFWMGPKGYCRFEWGEDYPVPAEMIRGLREKGYHLSLWEHPYIDIDTEMFREGDKNGFFLKNAHGATYVANLVIAPGGTKEEYKEEFYDAGGIVDFSNKDAVEWYKSKHRPLFEMGVDVFKTDFGEEIPKDAHWHNGLSGNEMHNVYSLLYNKTVFEVTAEYTDRPFVWGRSGYAGSQKYPVQWSGDPLTDFPSMSSTLRGGLSYGLSGVPFWTHDLGGFKGSPTEEVYIRWIQFGLFTSLSRLHGTTTRMPWKYSTKVQEVFKKYIELRYRLLPYIYSTAKTCVTQGLPFIRPLVLEYPSDPATHHLDQQYLFGDSLLIVPVFNEQGRVDVYLPEGIWYDFWTGEKSQGPHYLRRYVQLDEMPIYVKEDSIIPYAPLRQRIVEGEWNPLTLQLWLGKKARLILKDDEGDTEFEAVRQEDTIMVNIGKKVTSLGEDFTYRIQIPVDESITSVSFNGRLLTRVDPGDGDGYWINSGNWIIQCRGSGELRIQIESAS